MGKKKKKKKKAQKGAQSQLHNLTLEQLIQTGKQSLEAEKPRDAIGVFKFAGKKHGQTDEISTLLFRAYLMREAQLREKNLIIEADAVKKQAQEYMPWVDHLSEEDMLAYISTCSNKEAVDIYAGYLKGNKRSPGAEQFLANRAFKSEAYDVLEKLDESLPIRRDSVPVQEAVPLMNQGEWEYALKTLGPIGRTSPFAPVRMFCRAMVSFYKEDDKDMAKALSMIPDDFPLINVALNLQETTGNGNNRNASKKLRCLWDGPVNIEEDIGDMLHDLEHRRFHLAKRSIADLSEAIYPDDPISVRTFILETLWNMTYYYKMEDYEFRNMVTELLPPDQAELLMTKTRLIRLHTPFTTAGQYISMLESEFPTPEIRKIAHAYIILYTIDALRKGKFNLAKEKKGILKYKEIFGVHHEDQEMLLIDMTTQAIRLDPADKKGYETLTALPRVSRQAKNMVEKTLTDMLGQFPDDPWPCLELASLFYEKNAFRKAENILEEAMKRAPHDSRVIDRHALALLISAEKNIIRKKFHLVERDIKKAEALESRKIEPLIIEKRIVFKITKDPKTSKDQVSLFGGNNNLKALLAEELDQVSPADRLRVLAILMADIRYRKVDDKKYLLKEVEKAFDKELKSAKEISSADVSKLLTPLKKEYKPLFPSLEIAPIFLKKRKDILKNVDNSEIIPIFDLIFAPEWFALIRKEVKRRVKNAKKKDRVLMEFYDVTIQHIQRKARGSDLYEDILEDVSVPVMEEVRAASRRLSVHAAGPLKKALEMFDFDILDDMPLMGRFFPEDDMDDFFPDDDVIDIVLPGDDMEGELEDLIDQLRELEAEADILEPATIPDKLINDLANRFESFVDSLGLRSAPSFVINELREILRSDFRARRDFDMMAEIIDYSGASERLSREAKILLFGNRRRTGKKRKKK